MTLFQTKTASLKPYPYSLYIGVSPHPPGFKSITLGSLRQLVSTNVWFWKLTPNCLHGAFKTFQKKNNNIFFSIYFYFIFHILVDLNLTLRIFLWFIDFSQIITFHVENLMLHQ